MKKFLFLSPMLALAAATPRRLGVTGTYDLAWLRVNFDRKLRDLDTGQLLTVVQTELAAHNERAAAMVAAFAVRVDKRETVDASGTNLTGTMTEVDEYGRARTQTAGVAGDVAFPLRRYQFAAGYTADFFRKGTAQDFVEVLDNAQAAHRKELVKQIRDRLFSPVNYNFQDFLTDGKTVNVRALFNADGTVAPTSPNLVNFDGTHTHYLGFTALNSTNLSALIATVREHGDDTNVEVHLAQAQEAAVKALAGFAPVMDVQIQVASTSTVAVGALNTANPANRKIGRYDGADVFVKPWVFDNYGLAIDTNSQALGIRHPDDLEDEGLRPIGQIVTFPLQSDYWGAEFGIGTRNRRGAAVAQFNSGTAGVYTDPTGRSW